MKKEKKKKDRTNFGVAFIFLEKQAHVEKIIYDLRNFKKRVLKEEPITYDKLEVRVSILLSLSTFDRTGLWKEPLVRQTSFGKTSM